jgi:hypothetical protein
MFGELAKALYESQVEKDQLGLMVEAAGDALDLGDDDVDMDDLDSMVDGDTVSDDELSELDQALDAIINGDADISSMTREQIEDTIANV